MTVQEFMADQIERMAESFGHFIETTNPERVDWKPEVDGSAPTRSILEQAGECVAVNRYFAALLRGETVEVPQGGVSGISPSNAVLAREELVSSAGELAEAVRGLDDEGMTRNYHHWRGEVQGYKLFIGAYRNMAYHAGQTNLIQILGGDPEFHVPPRWY